MTEKNIRLHYHNKLWKNNQSVNQLGRQAGRGWRSVVSANRLISQFPIPSFTVEIIYIITTICITFLFTSIWNDNKNWCSDISFQMQHCFCTYITKPRWKIYRKIYHVRCESLWLRKLFFNLVVCASKFSRYITHYHVYFFFFDYTLLIVICEQQFAFG